MDTIDQSILNISALRKADQETIDRDTPFSPSREEALGLTHRKGDIIYDERTGKNYTVVAGTRKSVTVQASGS